MTVFVEVRPVKIYVAAVAALKENERLDKTQFTTKIGGKTSLGPSHFVHYYAETGRFQGK